MKHSIPVCPTCGASLPHTHPVALQRCQQQEERNLFDEAIDRASALGRPFTEEEVLQPAWDLGYELIMSTDSRFVLVQESQGRKPRLWGLRTEEDA